MSSSFNGAAGGNQRAWSSSSISLRSGSDTTAVRELRQQAPLLYQPLPKSHASGLIRQRTNESQYDLALDFAPHAAPTPIDSAPDEISIRENYRLGTLSENGLDGRPINLKAYEVIANSVKELCQEHNNPVNISDSQRANQHDLFMRFYIDHFTQGLAGFGNHWSGYA